MTNLVFIGHKKVPRDHAKAIKQDLLLYATSVALKFPTEAISPEEKTKVAKRTVFNILKKHDLATKHLGSLIQDEIIKALQKVYFKIKSGTRSSNFLFVYNKKLSGDLIEMVKIVKLLKNKNPKRYKCLLKNLKKQFSRRQKTIFNLYLKFKPRGKRKKLTYRQISRVSKIPACSINHQVKQIIHSLNKAFKTQRIKHGKRTR